MSKWVELSSFDGAVNDLEFISPTQGWAAGYRVEEAADDEAIELWSDYRRSQSCVWRTGDAGRVWELVHQGAGRFLLLQYLAEERMLYGVREVYVAERNPPLTWYLERSADGGSTWERIKEAPSAITGMRFSTPEHGYLWSATEIFAVSARGAEWQFIGSRDTDPVVAKINSIGQDGTLYFIHERSLQAVNPWSKRPLRLPVAPALQVKAIAVGEEDELYLLAKEGRQWNLLTCRNEKILSSSYPTFKSKSDDVFYLNACAGILRLVLLDESSFLPKYFFYSRGSQGWNEEELSGKKDFKLVSCWRDLAWAIRINLLDNTYRLFRQDISI